MSVAAGVEARGWDWQFSGRTTPALHDLSAREREVAVALGAGSTKREIAEKLGVKFSTVNTLVTRIYRKLGVTRRAQLVNVIRNGG